MFYISDKPDYQMEFQVSIFQACVVFKIYITLKI